jgi:hypothetical protein
MVLLFLQLFAPIIKILIFGSAYVVNENSHTMYFLNAWHSLQPRVVILVKSFFSVQPWQFTLFLDHFVCNDV